MDREALIGACEIRRIDIRTKKGLQVTLAFVKGALAAHHRHGVGGWSVTHLPTGLSFSPARFVFRSAEIAVAAMLDLEALTPDWADLSPSQIKPLGPSIREIGLQHGGEVYDRFDETTPLNERAGELGRPYNV